MEVAQVLPGDGGVGRGRYLRLGPEPHLHAPLVGIGREGREVVHVGRNGGEALGRAPPVRVHPARHLVPVVAVPGAVAVVGEDPPERHVVTRVLVYDGAGRELVRGAPAIPLGRGAEDLVLAVERLCVMALGDHVAATTPQLVAGDARRVRGDGPAHRPGLGISFRLAGPRVAVVRVEVPQVEGELGEKGGRARDLVVGAQNRLGGGAQVARLGQEEVGVEDRVLVRRAHDVTRGAEVVRAGGERASQHAVARARPEERARGGNAAVPPLVAVHGRGHDAHDAAGVVHAPVLRAAAEEALAGRELERLGGGAGLQAKGRGLARHHAAAEAKRHPSRGRVHEDGGRARAGDERAVLLGHVRGGVRVDGELVGLCLDPSHVVRGDGARVRRELARRVHRDADDALVEKRDAARQVLLAGTKGDERLVGTLGAHTNINHVPLLC